MHCQPVVSVSILADTDTSNWQHREGFWSEFLQSYRQVPVYSWNTQAAEWILKALFFCRAWSLEQFVSWASKHDW